MTTLLNRNPAIGVDLPRLTSKKRRYLRHEQLHALASAAGGYRVLVLSLGYCSAVGPYIDPRWRVRHDRVDRAGTVTLRHDSRLHHIGVGRPHSGTRVTLLVDDLHIRIINRDAGGLLRELTLDRHQGLPTPMSRARTSQVKALK